PNQEGAQNGISSQPDQIGAARGTAPPGRSLPSNNLHGDRARSSPDECNDLAGSSSPFQINDGRAHIDQETLRQQTRTTSTEVVEPARNRKRAASKVSGAGAQETDKKPKRKRTYK